MFARHIRVQGQRDVGRVPFQQPHLRLSQRRAHARDDVRNADLVRHQHIHVSLDDHREVCIADRLAGHVQAEEHASLVKERCLRRIHVLRARIRRIFTQDPRPEADRPPLSIANRNHQPAAKPVEVTSGLLLPDDQAGFFKLLGPVALALQPIFQCIPAVQRIPKLPVFPGLPR